jgi:hypothetical protein
MVLFETSKAVMIWGSEAVIRFWTFTSSGGVCGTTVRRTLKTEQLLH